MTPRPQADNPARPGSGKLTGKVAIITGGDSGIGRAVAVAFAREGADLAIAYLDEHEDAEETQRMVQEEGRRCITIPGDVGKHEHVDGVRLCSGASITIDGPRDQDLWASGERVGALPSTIDVVPGALRVLVPPDSRVGR